MDSSVCSSSHHEILCNLVLVIAIFSLNWFDIFTTLWISIIILWLSFWILPFSLIYFTLWFVSPFSFEIFQRNKRDFFIFLCLGTLTALVGGLVAVQSMLKPLNLCICLEYLHLDWIFTASSNMTGIWTSVPVPQGDETWIHHVIFAHPGIAAFIMMDTIILAATTTLLTVQASQVKHCSLHSTYAFLSPPLLGKRKG